MRGLFRLVVTSALVALAGCNHAAKASWVEQPAALPGPQRRSTIASTAVEPAALVDPAWRAVHDGDATIAVQPKRLGVVLPLSGKWTSIGVELKAAILLARADVEVQPELVFFDSAGDPATAERAVDDAVAAGVVAIIGPVGQREALAAAARASIRNVPIALLSPADGADPAAGVFRMVLSPADEARLAARLAADAGYPTVGVLTPRDDTGAAQALAFADEARALGLTVTATGSYDPSGTNLEPDIKQFLNLVPAKNPRLRRHLARYGKRGWQTFSPDVPYTLLYVPDQYDHAALVASFLPYLGVELHTVDFPDQDMLRRKHGGQVPQVVQLLGDSGWNHPSLAIRGGSAVEGALVIDVFSPDMGGEFAPRYQAATQRVPSTAAAQAYDAMLLVQAAWAAAAGTATPRTAFAQALVGASLDDGACGTARIGLDGEIVREALVLEVSGGELVAAPW